MEIKRLVNFTLFVFLKVLIKCTDVQSQESPGSSDDFIPCEKGWFYFENTCYFLGGRNFGERLNWNKSSERCRFLGGSLIYVKSRAVQEFIVAFLQLDIKIPTWIGLRKSYNDSGWEWDSGDPYNYTNWAPYQPSGAPPDQHPENCVEMFFMPLERIIGKWNDVMCYHEYPYICEKKPNVKLLAPSLGSKRTIDPRFCSREDGSGWKLKNSCYNLIIEKKTWDEAERYCKEKFKGHLVTIRDVSIDFFLEYMLSNFNKDVWIGIKIKEQMQQKWSSGFHVAYNDWPDDFKEFVEGTCTYRVKADVWDVDQCSRELAFVCEKSKEEPKVLPPPPEGAKCPTVPDDWRDLDGESCYYFEMRRHKYVSWYQASFECMRRGGSLISIHSKIEVDVLTPFLFHKEQNFYIGLYRTLVKADSSTKDLVAVSTTTADESFRWSDGTPLDFVFWEPNEPSDEIERCGELWSRTMRWLDTDCEKPKGYICATKKVITGPVVEKAPEKSPDCDNSHVHVGFLVGIGVSCFLNAILVVLLICCRRRKTYDETTTVRYEEPATCANKWHPQNYVKGDPDDDSLYENMN